MRIHRPSSLLLHEPSRRTLLFVLIAILFGFGIFFVSQVSPETVRGDIIYTDVAEDHTNDLQIYVTDSVGSGPRKLIDNDHSNYAPNVSSSGNFIVFISADRDVSNLYLMERATSTTRQLTYFTDTNTSIETPIWAPNEERIAFVATDEAKNQSSLYFVNPDGSNLTARAVKGIVDTIVWSPDSAYIAFDMSQEHKGVSYRVYTNHLSFVQTSVNDLEGISFWCQPKQPKRSFDENNNISSRRTGRRDSLGVFDDGL